MKPVLIIVLFFNLIGLKSQSFDWEISSREPFEIPKTYLFVNFNYGNSNVNNQISVFNENQYFESFSKNKGKINSIGFGFENWFSNKIASQISLNLLNQSSNFDKITSYPIYSGENLSLNNIYNLNLNIVTLSLGIKFNVYENVNVFLNFDQSALSFSNHNFNLEVINPVWFEFKNNTKKEELFNNDIVTSSVSIIGFGISYNIKLPYPFYLTPYFNFSRNLNSIFDNQDHYINSIQLGVNLYYGISDLKLF